jgi:hypothetical protein
MMGRGLRGDDQNNCSYRVIKSSPAIDHYIDYIVNKEFRLKDGVLARNRPQKNTLWLDDMYMGIPAIAQMGKLRVTKNILMMQIKQVLGFPNECSIIKPWRLHAWMGAGNDCSSRVSLGAGQWMGDVGDG